MVTFKKDLKLGTMVPLVKTSDIDNGAVTKEKMSPEMRKLIDGWNANKELVDTLPRDIVSDITLSAGSEQVEVECEVYHNSGSDDGYAPEYEYRQIPSATSDKAGVMTAADKRNLDKLVNREEDKSITDEEIEQITSI